MTSASTFRLPATLDQQVTTAPPEDIETPATVAAALACDACEHPLEDHDVVGRRYCSATFSSALTRGCICA